MITAIIVILLVTFIVLLSIAISVPNLHRTVFVFMITTSIVALVGLIVFLSSMHEYQYESTEYDVAAIAKETGARSGLSIFSRPTGVVEHYTVPALGLEEWIYYKGLDAIDDEDTVDDEDTGAMDKYKR